MFGPTGTAWRSGGYGGGTLAKLKSKLRLKPRCGGSGRESTSSPENPDDGDSSGEEEGMDGRKGVYKKYDPRRLRRGLKEGIAPAGYCYVWVGNFRRWQRRYFVAHTPGVLLYYKRNTRHGPSWSVDLTGARVLISENNNRQIVIVSGEMLYYVRCMHKSYRQAWYDSLHKSQRTFEAAIATVQADVNTGKLGFLSTIKEEPLLESPQPEQVLRQTKEKEQMKMIEDRVTEAMAGLHAQQQCVLLELQHIQHGLLILAGAIDVSPGVGSLIPNAPSSPQRASPDTHFATPAALLSPDVDVVQTPPPRVGLRPMVLEPSPPGQSHMSTGLERAREQPVENPLMLPRGREEGGQTGVAAGGLQGQLGVAWGKLQAVTLECFQKEVLRHMELELENAALQQIVRGSQKSKRKSSRGSKQDLLNRYKRNGARIAMTGMDETGEGGEAMFSDSGSSEDEVSDMDDPSVHCRSSHELFKGEAAIHRGGEEFFEALEVLNQHTYYVNHGEGSEGGMGSSIGMPDSNDSRLPDQDDDDGDDEDDDGADEGASDSDADEGAVVPRSCLPAPASLDSGFNLWSVLKNALGRDLNSITLPATINQPLSVLQCAAEEMEYVHLLEKALEQETSLERLLYIAAFVVSPYSSAQRRIHKPFNPVLGETFEWVQEGRYRWLSEQVSHHPPVTAWHAQGIGPKERDYTFYGELEFRNRFWGKTADLIPVGSVHLKVPALKEHYSWNKVKVAVHNLILGSIWPDIHGEIVIQNHATKEYAKVSILKATSKDGVGEVQGTVHDGAGQTVYKLSGNHLRGLYAELDPSAPASAHFPLPPSTIFSPNPPLFDPQKQYNFSKFALALNEVTDRHLLILPPTDSRLRPDQRALEHADISVATSEKLRLEEKQRQQRKERKRCNVSYTPQWFKCPPDSKKPVAIQHFTPHSAELDVVWQFTTTDRDYWAVREKGNWDEHNLPDIF